MPPGVSDLPGLEIAGTVAGRAMPQDLAAAGFKLGDRCARWWPAAATPSCAWHRRASACRCRGLSDVEAASLPETFFTVWQNVFDHRAPAGGRDAAGAGRLQRHRRHGHPAGQGAGRAVIVTAGSDDKCAACVALGADHAINYRTRTSCRGQAPDRRARRGRGARHGGRRLRGARGDLPGRRRPAGDHRGAGRHEGARSTPGCAAQAAVPSPARRCVRAGGLQDRLARALRARSGR
jgi:hypothetical protein